MSSQSDRPTTLLEILTDDLRLVAATRKLLEADLHGLTADNAEDRHIVAELLDAEMPGIWPPELYERDDIERMLDLLAQGGGERWGLWYLVSRRPLAPGKAGRGTVVGVAGFAGPPDGAGNVTLGYSIVPEARRRGFASQAVRVLVGNAFRDCRTRSVSAETFETLTPSIGVLDKCGFVREGEARTPGAINFVCRAPSRPLDESGTC